MAFRYRQLYSGRLFQLGDYVCRAPAHVPSQTEVASGYELILVRRGAFVVHVAGREFFMTANEALLLAPDQPYWIDHPVPGGDECTVITVPRELMEQHSAELPARRIVHERLFLSAHELMTRLSGNREPLELDEHLVAMLDAALIDREPGDAPIIPRQKRAVRSVQELMSARFHESLPLDLLSSTAGLSPFYLSRVFRRIVGVPMHRYQSGLRLREALRRISEGERDLTSLALDLGFADHSHFTAAFRRYFGATPSAIRSRPIRDPKSESTPPKPDRRSVR